MPFLLFLLVVRAQGREQGRSGEGSSAAASLSSPSKVKGASGGALNVTNRL